LKHFLGGGFKLSKILIVVSVLVIIGTVIVGRITHAGFKSSISVPLAKGKITYKKSDFSLVGLYVENASGSYTLTTSVPSGDYEVNASKTYCTKPSGSTQVNDPNVKVIYEENSLTFKKVTAKDTKCYVYLDKIELPTINVSQILAKYTKNTSRSGQITVGFKESTPTTVYSKEDDYGTSYVFAGINPNNWVKIDNIYFRIIRFNGNGSMRLIYSGEGRAEITGEDTQIGSQRYRTQGGYAEYVGLQYTIGQVHGTSVNSEILGESTSTDTTTLYGWYNSKIKPSYEKLIDINTGFCNDRDSYKDKNGTTSGGGIGESLTYYRPYVTYLGEKPLTILNPILKCKNASDNLKLPVGLITLDEYMLAGGGSPLSSEYYNTSFWLNTGQYYWTMSPSNSTALGNTQVFCIYDGFYSPFYNNNSVGVRPVINLKSTTTFIEGTGTSTNPYIVKTP